MVFWGYLLYFTVIFMHRCLLSLHHAICPPGSVIREISNTFGRPLAADRTWRSSQSSSSSAGKSSKRVLVTLVENERYCDVVVSKGLPVHPTALACSSFLSCCTISWNMSYLSSSSWLSTMRTRAHIPAPLFHPSRSVSVSWGRERTFPSDNSIECTDFKIKFRFNDGSDVLEKSFSSIGNTGVSAGWMLGRLRSFPMIQGGNLRSTRYRRNAPILTARSLTEIKHSVACVCGR